MPQLFGTDGLRGALEEARLAPSFFQKLGWAIGRFVQETQGPNAQKNCLMAWDTRASGPQLGQALCDGLGVHGFGVLTLGVASTAALAYTTLESRACLGLMITASHNPATDNGLKLISPSGHKLSEAQEAHIEALLALAPEHYAPAPLLSYPEGLHFYEQALKRLVPSLQLEKCPFVLDCAHGAASRFAASIFRHYGWHGMVLGDTPNGVNINQGAGSEHPEALGACVRAQGAPFGLAFDGDADRLLVCGPSGQVLPGEVLLALMARRLPAKSLCVTTHYSNRGLDPYLEKHSLKLMHVDVGDRHVAAAMEAHGAALGAEPSGHIIWAPHSWCADGVAAALLLLDVLEKAKTPLETLAAQVPLLPRAEGVIVTPYRGPLDPELRKELSYLEATLRPEGRLFIRFSGTQDLLRLFVEAKTLSLAQKTLHLAMKGISRSFGIA